MDMLNLKVATILQAVVQRTDKKFYRERSKEPTCEFILEVHTLTLNRETEKAAYISGFD